MDTSSIIAMLAGAVGSLFALLTGVYHKRIQTLETEVAMLETEAKKYMAIILQAGDSAEDVQEMRREIARLLREK